MHKRAKDGKTPATDAAHGDGRRSPPSTSPSIDDVLIEALSADVLRTLGAVQVAAFVVDHERRVRWQNGTSMELVGDLRGKLDRSFIAPEDLARTREAFARKQMGALHTEFEPQRCATTEPAFASP